MALFTFGCCSMVAAERQQCTNQSIGPLQQQTRRSDVLQPDGTDGETDGNPTVT